MFNFILFSFFVHGVIGANLVDELSARGFSTLVNLVQQAGLEDAIRQGQLTVFAPTNAAFNKIPAADLHALASDVNKLADVLKYHVVAGNIQKSDASNELELMTLEGKKARINIYSHNHVVTIEGARISQFDIRCDNGYIHVLDSVMMPPAGNIVDLVVATPELSTLLAQVQSAGLASALQGNNLTVFAPTNDAFARLGSATLHKLASNPSLLKDILLYHVVPHTEYSAGLFNRELIRTLDAHHDVLRIHTTQAGVYVNNGHVIKADISATNGVVHLINHVLVPFRHLIEVGK